MQKAVVPIHPEFRAEARFQRSSPQKAKLVLDLIKGLPVGKAITTAAFTNKRIAPIVEKVLRSAVAERAAPLRRARPGHRRGQPLREDRRCE
jgi:large subunit ribosomal protein L22